jgi:hypothetical protein
MADVFSSIKQEYWWDVRLDFVRQFKMELVRRLECLVFEGKKDLTLPNLT